MSVRDTWTIGCHDMAGRRRNMTVFVNDGTIVLVAPPGESAVLTRLEVGELRGALRDAVFSTEEITQASG